MESREELKDYFYPNRGENPVLKIHLWSHLSDEGLQQRGGAFPDASHGEPETATAPLHDPVISLMSVQSLRQHRPNLQVSHMIKVIY